MSTVREILRNNRESIISEIKWTFKVWKKEDLKKKMIDFLSWAEKNKAEIIKANQAKNTKTILRSFVRSMAYEQTLSKREAERKAEEERNMRMYGTAKPKLADLLAYSAEKEREKGNVWHPIYKIWVKDEGPYSSMKK